MKFFADAADIARNTEIAAEAPIATTVTWVIGVGGGNTHTFVATKAANNVWKTNAREGNTYLATLVSDAVLGKALSEPEVKTVTWA